MWYIHHLSEKQRAMLAEQENFVLPLMPEDVASIEAREAEFDHGKEYSLQISCTDCHTLVFSTNDDDDLDDPIVEEPLPEGPQNVQNCPIDDETGLPTVWQVLLRRSRRDLPKPLC